MFIRKRTNKSGSVSVQIFKKIRKQNVLIKHIGTANGALELDYLLKTSNKLIDDFNLEIQPSLFSTPSPKSDLISLFKTF